MAELLDAVGVALALGGRVVCAIAGMHATGQLVPGTIRQPPPRSSLSVCLNTRF